MPAPPAPTSLNEALSALFALGRSLLHAQRYSLYLHGDDNALRLYDGVGLPERDRADTVSTDGTVAGHVMRTRVPLLVENVALYPALPTHPDRYTTASFVSVPVVVENDAMGVLNAADHLDGALFSEDDLHNAEMVARSIAAVLHSDLMARRALDGGEIDGATGLYNRRHLEKRLAQEASRSEQSASPLTLLILQVAGYAEVAGRAGVQTAEVLMRCVGEMIAHVVRQSDVVSHFSADQIAVLLPATPLDRARRVARSIAREVVHDKLPAHLRYEVETLDIHIGLAALTSATDDGVIRRAQEALEAALARGDRVATVAGETVAGEMAAEAPRRVAPAHHEALTTALRLGIPYLADPAAAATESALRLLSPEAARAYACVPIAFEAGTLTLAMADPADTSAIHAVSQLTKMAVYPVISPRERILQAIATLMGLRKRGSAGVVHIHIPSASDPAAIVEQVERLSEVLRELQARGLAIEATVSALPKVGTSRERLLAELADHAILPLQPDEHDGTLLHLISSD